MPRMPATWAPGPRNRPGRRLGRLLLGRLLPGPILLGALLALAAAGCHRRQPAAPADPAPTMTPALWQRLQADEAFFPIGVWFQSLSRLEQYRAIGINLFVAPNGEADAATLGRFEQAGMFLVPARSPGFPQDRSAGSVIGWWSFDEPDNAQPRPEGGWGPCIEPEEMQARYRAIRQRDHRPVVLGLGKGAVDPGSGARGTCAGRGDDYYPALLAAADIVAFDTYPLAEGHRRLENVAIGVRNIRRWMALGRAGKPIWTTLQAGTVIGGPVPTLADMRAMAWLAVINGSRGLVWFPWRVARDGQRLREDELFAHPGLPEALATVNAEIRRYAPVLKAGKPLPIAHAGQASVAAFAHAGEAYVFVASEVGRPSRIELAAPWLAGGTRSLAAEPYGVTILRLPLR